MDDIGNILLQNIAAIVVVVLFLRFLKEERDERRSERVAFAEIMAGYLATLTKMEDHLAGHVCTRLDCENRATAPSQRLHPT